MPNFCLIPKNIAYCIIHIMRYRICNYHPPGTYNMSRVRDVSLMRFCDIASTNGDKIQKAFDSISHRLTEVAEILNECALH